MFKAAKSYSHSSVLSFLLIFSLFTLPTPAARDLDSLTGSTGPLLQQEQLAPLDGYNFQYTSFTGVTYNLTAFNGKSVRYALPTSWTQPGALTSSQVRKLIDLTDLTCAQLIEITSGEPQGDGLLTIAVIPTQAAAGHASSNFKGVELSENQLGSVMQNLEKDLLSPELIHELSHNWDLFINYTSPQYPDSEHAWTAFLIPYIQYYSRAGTLQSDADALLQKKISEYTYTWDATGATWQQCAKDGNNCPNIQANNAWAGLLLRFTKLHGSNSLKRAFTYLRDYATSHPATGTNPTSPRTSEERNNLLVEALAAGAQTNILCELDTWRWSASSETRTKISQRYPGPNFICIDADNDSFSPLKGDTDDTNPQIKPSAIETTNNIDDDCDGVIDDILLTEQADFPSSLQAAQPVSSIPAKIRGQVTTSDVDAFLISSTNTLPRRLRFNLQSPNTFVGFIQLQALDLSGRTQSFSVAGGGAQILTIPQAGLWVLTVINANSPPSDYSLTIEDAGPATASIRLNVTPGKTANMIDIGTTIDMSKRGNTTAPNAIRFWLSSTGFSQAYPLQEQFTLPLQIPAGTGTFSLRAELVSNNVPVNKATLPLFINGASREMAERTPDLIITPDTVLPRETSVGTNIPYGFTITNSGPGLAQQIEVSLSLPAGLAAISSATTLGTSQLSNTFRLNISALATGETASFSLMANDISAEGTLTTAATITAVTTDPNTSNNSATITGYFIPAPTPTPTPAPTATPTPIPTPTPTPGLELMLDQSGPTLTQAAALDSVSFLRDPFPVINASDLFNLGTDRNTRVIVFVANLQVAQSPSTEVLITLVDANNQIFDLTAEDVRYVGNLQITQVTFRLPDALSLGVCTVRIKTPLQTSNQGTIRIRNSL